MACRVERNPHSPDTQAIDTEVAAVPARSLLTRILPVAAISAGLFVAAPVADAAQGKKKDKPVIAKTALGDKRVKKAQASAKKPKAKAKISQAPCQNTDVLPTPANV